MNVDVRPSVSLIPARVGFPGRNAHFGLTAFDCLDQNEVFPPRGKASERNRVTPIHISGIPRGRPGRTQPDYLHCLQQPAREKGPVFGKMYVSPGSQSQPSPLGLKPRASATYTRNCRRSSHFGYLSYSQLLGAKIWPFFRKKIDPTCCCARKQFSSRPSMRLTGRDGQREDPLRQSPGVKHTLRAKPVRYLKSAICPNWFRRRPGRRLIRYHTCGDGGSTQYYMIRLPGGNCPAAGCSDTTRMLAERALRRCTAFDSICIQGRQWGRLAQKSG